MSFVGSYAACIGFVYTLYDRMGLVGWVLVAFLVDVGVFGLFGLVLGWIGDYVGWCWVMVLFELGVVVVFVVFLLVELFWVLVVGFFVVIVVNVFFVLVSTVAVLNVVGMFIGALVLMYFIFGLVMVVDFVLVKEFYVGLFGYVVFYMGWGLVVLFGVWLVGRVR